MRNNFVSFFEIHHAAPPLNALNKILQRFYFYLFIFEPSPVGVMPCLLAPPLTRWAFFVGSS
jgi:hypothetical protein